MLELRIWAIKAPCFIKDSWWKRNYSNLSSAASWRRKKASFNYRRHDSDVARKKCLREWLSGRLEGSSLCEILMSAEKSERYFSAGAKEEVASINRFYLLPLSWLQSFAVSFWHNSQVSEDLLLISQLFTTQISIERTKNINNIIRLVDIFKWKS